MVEMIINIGDPLYRPFPKGVAPFNLPNYHETLLALIPRQLIVGNPTSGVVGLNGPAPEGGTVVSLKSDRPDIVSVPNDHSRRRSKGIRHFRRLAGSHGPSLELVWACSRRTWDLQ
jgi:hypothetical protein